jgi:hypothetical protein
MVKKADETKEEEKEGEEEKEVSLEQILSQEFKAMDAQLSGLETHKAELTTAVKEVTDIIYKEIVQDEDKKTVPPGEFSDPETFRNKLDGLYQYLGEALDYVVRLEKQRGMVFQEEQHEQEVERKEALPSPVNVTFSPPAVSQPLPVDQQKQRFGLFALLDNMAARKYNEKLIEQQNSVQQPIVATTKIVDVVEFGRQLQPAFNKIKVWLFGSLAQIRHYQNEHIYIVLHEELATYFGETIGALITFVNARVEYRRSLIEGRKLALVRAMARIAEARSMAPQVQVGGTFAQKGFKLSKDGFTERD